MQLIDPKHKFYEPLWVRVLVVAAVAGWFGFELYMGMSFWVVIVGALAVYSAWVLLFRFEGGRSATMDDPASEIPQEQADIANLTEPERRE